MTDPAHIIADALKWDFYQERALAIANASIAALASAGYIIEPRWRHISEAPTPAHPKDPNLPSPILLGCEPCDEVPTGFIGECYWRGMSCWVEHEAYKFRSIVRPTHFRPVMLPPEVT